MDPVTAGIVIVGVLGTLAQAYQSSKSSGANKAELDKLREDFDNIKPPNYNVSITDPPEYITKTVPEPAVDYSKMSPEAFKVVGQYNPIMATYVGEKQPQLVKLSQEGQQGKDAQLAALKEMRQRATSSQTDPVLQSQLDAANKSSQINAQSREQSILQDAQRRGQLGSGLMLAGQLESGESAMDRAAQSSQAAALAAYQDKLQALRDSANLGGTIANQDADMQSRNAGILNDFNARTSKNANQYNQYSTGVQNDAQRMNLDTAQKIANQNTSLNNDFAQKNRDMENKGAMDAYTRALNERNYQNQIEDKSYQNTLNQQNTTNKLKSQQYADQLAQAQGANGIANQYMSYNNQVGQNNANTINGVSQAGLGGLTYYGNDKARKENNKAKYGSTGEEDDQEDSYS